jgi:hypothetical protein
MSDRLEYVPDEVEEVGTVTFRPVEPEDEHAARLMLRVSAAAWIAQGCPRVIDLTMTTPRPEEQLP